MGRLSDFFVGDLLARQRDEFERARVRLTFNFSAAYLPMVALSIPVAFTGSQQWLVFWLNTAAFVLHMVPLALLKLGRSHRGAAALFCCIAFCSAAAHSIRLAGDLSPVTTSWYFLVIVFAHFTLGGRYTAVFSIAVFAMITATAVARIKAPEVFPLAPTPEREVLGIAPFVVAFGLAALGLLLREFSRTRRRAREALRASNKAKDHILGTVAHDLRNPVGAIKSIASLLAHLPEDRRKQSLALRLEQIDAACDLAEGIINDLVDAAELDQDDTEIRVELIDLRAFVISAVELYRTQAIKKRIEVNAELPEEALEVPINKVRFSRVLDNLLSNALKFCNEGGRVQVTVARIERCAEITVADNGIGIPAALHGRIFERFSDAGRPGTAHERSTGLGLSIARQIVQQHGGRIWFESRENQGSTFHVLLPLGRASDDSALDARSLCPEQVGG